MENTDLIKVQDELETIFKINILHSVDKAESLYKRFSDILSKKDELLAFIKSKRYEYRSVIKDSMLYSCFLDYISAIAKIHNIPVSSDIYDLELFKKLISFVCYEPSDDNYLKYNNLFDYIFYLLQDIASGYTKEEDWKSLIKIFNEKAWNLDITYDEFVLINKRFNLNKDKIYKAFSKLYDYHAYLTNRDNKLLSGSLTGRTVSLFLLPLKSISLDLISYIDTLVYNEVLYQDKVEHFIKENNLTGKTREIFIYRCNNPDKSSNDICKHFGISSSYLDDCMNAILPALRVAAGLTDDKNFRFKKTFEYFIKNYKIS